MSEQKELFSFKKPKIKPEPDPTKYKRSRRERLEEGIDFSEKIIRETREPHVCRRCEREISAGSSAMTLIPIENGIKQPDKIEYYHIDKNCHEINDGGSRPGPTPSNPKD